jgi:hypothetical protein
MYVRRTSSALELKCSVHARAHNMHFGNIHQNITIRNCIWLFILLLRARIECETPMQVLTNWAKLVWVLAFLDERGCMNMPKLTALGEDLLCKYGKQHGCVDCVEPLTASADLFLPRCTHRWRIDLRLSTKGTLSISDMIT